MITAIFAIGAPVLVLLAMIHSDLMRIGDILAARNADAQEASDE